MTVRATSLKMPAELKTRVEAAAKAAGTSSHAFMLTAIERETMRAEKYAAFIGDAKRADRELERTGEYYDADAVFRYLEARTEGKPARRPKSKTWRR
jgi:predicted DNA-binding protein